MFLFNSLRAQHDLLQESITAPGHSGLKLSFSHFDGYSPMLDGAVRVAVVDSPSSEKSGTITVTINVKSSDPSYKNNIRIRQQDNEITISTGGLSLLSYATAPRLIINVVISLPRSIGDLAINTLSLPIIIQRVEKGGDIVLKTESSPIDVENVESRSLTVSTHSGMITFQALSEQIVDKFIRVSNNSGGTAMRSSLSSPSVSVEATSGSLGLAATTTATELKVKNMSGSISGGVEYSKATSSSSYENSSGALSITLKEWTGFLTASSSSGSKKVEGRGLEKWNDGWKKGDGDSKARFTTQSGSIRVEVL